MKKVCYMRVLSKYYEIENNTNIRLGYREGKDKIHLVIGKRRDRYIENADAKYLYIVRAEKNEYDRYQVAEYQKIKATKVDDEYVIDVQKLLKKLKLNYRELDGKEFSKTKKYEGVMPGEAIYPYAFVAYDRSWADIEVNDIDLYYLKNAFKIGDTEIRHAFGRTFWRGAETLRFLFKSAEKKTSMDKDAFAEFINGTGEMEKFKLEWDCGSLEMDGMSEWFYQGWFDCDGETKEVSLLFDEANDSTVAFLYKCIQFKKYEEFHNFEVKKKMLGV